MKVRFAESEPLSEEEAAALANTFIPANQPMTAALVKAVMTNKGGVTKAQMDDVLREMFARTPKADMR